MPSQIITPKHLEEIESRATVRFGIIKSTLDFLLNSFEEIKNANIKVDDDQIKVWADEFIADLLKQE